MRLRTYAVVIALGATLLSITVHAEDVELANLRAADVAWNEAMQSRAHEQIARFYAEMRSPIWHPLRQYVAGAR